MGVGYEAYDNERQSLVALKTLPELNPGRLYLFKQEFRSLCRVSHSNLVTLHELFSEGDRWYFTMELIDGVGFLSYVRSESEKSEEETQTYSGANLPERILSGGCDYFKLRAALRQLTEGVAALHAEGKLHRDLKPSNVVVGRDGRVVVLDFGLVAEIDVGAAETVNKGRLAGTLSYMSPEQCAGGQLSAASDWYSVGVMMYQAITGKLPFSGTYLKVVMDKQSTEVSTTSALAPDVPPELDRLCLSLLRLNPAERSGAAEILASLGTAPPIEPAAGMAPQPVGEPAQFVGREAELAALEAALDHCREGHTVTVGLHGKSGIGKSSLANYFLNRAAGRGQTVVLAGRCYEQERVP